MPKWLVWGGLAVIGIFVALKLRSMFRPSGYQTMDTSGGLNGFAQYATANPWTPSVQSADPTQPTRDQVNKQIDSALGKPTSVGDFFSKWGKNLGSVGKLAAKI